MCDEAGVNPDVRDTASWVSLLRYIGCAGHAHKVATVFGVLPERRARNEIADSQ